MERLLSFEGNFPVSRFYFIGSTKKTSGNAMGFPFFSKLLNVGFLSFFLYSVSGFIVSLLLSYRFYSPCPILWFFCKFLNPLPVPLPIDLSFS